MSLNPDLDIEQKGHEVQILNIRSTLVTTLEVAKLVNHINVVTLYY